MLKTATSPNSCTLWSPGKKIEAFVTAPMTARALEIAKSREEVLGLLHDVPESEFELSFTDLVQKSECADDCSDVARGEGWPRPTVEEKMQARSSSCSFDGGRSSVLLNMHVPSLTRSLTASSTAARGAKVRKVTTEFMKRNGEMPAFFGCWSAIWNNLRKKSNKRQKKMLDERDQIGF